MFKLRNIILWLMDCITINLAYILALNLRFEWSTPEYYFKAYLGHIWVLLVVKTVIFMGFKMYSTMWRYANSEDYIKAIIASIVSNLATFATLIMMGLRLPRSIYAIVFIIDTALVLLARGFAKLTLREVSGHASDENKEKATLIIGAGQAGSWVLEEINKHPELGMKAIGFIDDDLTKKGKRIRNIKVLGTSKEIKKVVDDENVDIIVLAIPSMSFVERKQILEDCSKTKAKVKIVPGYYQLVDGGNNRMMIRDVEIEDLLGRKTVDLDVEILKKFIQNKTVLITGGGGSIGSEIARQVANYKPKKLILLDIYENNVYNIQMELNRHHKELDLVVLIESIRDAERISELMAEYKPDIVFNAAAHKHVPLMEFSAQSAIKNNVFGTYNVAKAASENGVKKFVQISTDKAVNPTNIMGTTKRICELTMQYWNAKSDTEYVAVRFGNVLGSNGSVIPLFKQQIQEGGPITVTHEDIIRYFMTIPEACQLVMTAGAMAKGGEVFILDMGEPVRIIDMARKLIKLSGYEPDKDIEIKIVGLRPGEKLFEELLLNKETSIATAHEKIFIDKLQDFDEKKYVEGLELLKEASKSEDVKTIRSALQKVVDTYHPYVPDEGKSK